MAPAEPQLWVAGAAALTADKTSLDGLAPNTEWLRGTVDLSKYGEILIDDKCATSLPGVFAAGDVTTMPFKQIIIASGEGPKAALSAFDHLIRSPAM